MGYLTNYKVYATGFKDPEEVEFFEFKLKKESEYGFDAARGRGVLEYAGSLSEAKWYNYDENLVKLTKAFPHITVDVEGKGEDDDDHWKARYRNGESETVRAVIMFPDFQELT